MSFTVVIVGRPNVGKSTLFNRLVGRRLALVDNQPGVTRDLREGQANLGQLNFIIIDTAGLEHNNDNKLQARMRIFTEHAIEQGDICIFMIDARSGILAADRVFSTLLRKKSSRIILVANKAEGNAALDGYYEAYSLGLGEPIALSAEHGDGMFDLQLALQKFSKNIDDCVFEPQTNIDLSDAVANKKQEMILSPVRPLQIAIIGRPNAGKSTLVNWILERNRLLTGAEAGITRDSISVNHNWNNVPFRIWDTAGIRKKAKVQKKLEKLSVSDGLRAVKFSEVVVVLLDAQAAFEQQDLRIINLAEREGRAIVIAINKWDSVIDKTYKRKIMQEKLTRLVPQLLGVPMVVISAKNGYGINRLHTAILNSYAVWNKRINTATLNRWLAQAIASHPPPAPNGRRLRLRYMTQVKSRPPSFVIMASYGHLLPTSYRRYLVNSLRSAMALYGTPIRIFIRSQSDKNPYKNRNQKMPTKLSKHLKNRY